ncbi:MAG: DEAD/DEAH box helicase [Hyphomicrobiaceae bacterium]
MTTFLELGLDARLLKALEAEGYTTPTPIQEKAIPPLLAGKDLVGIAQTGTGKTAAFALPILQRLAQDRRPAPRKGCRVLVLSPTRELATQIADSFRTYGRLMNLSVTVVFGGVGHRPQVQAIARGVDILVATPGRLLDHISQRSLSLEGTEIFVLDEVDQMLDLGFIQPIRRIVSMLSHKRQNLFFSATMPREIGKLADELLTDPVRVSVAPSATTVERVSQRVIHVETSKKRALLVELFADPELSRALVFTRTKRGADRVADHLETAGVTVAAIHGNKSQKQREQALEAFRNARIRVLVATDIAARGIDVDQVSHVVNFELPDVPESYVHRIGRTARAGAAGSAISLVDTEERDQLRDIERLTRQTIPAEDRRQDAGLTADRAGRPQRGRPSQDRGARRNGSGEPSRHRGSNGRNAPREGARERSGQSNGWRARDTDRNGAAGDRREGARGDRHQPHDRREAHDGANGDRHQPRDRREAREGARPNGEQGHNGYRHSDTRGSEARGERAPRPHSGGTNERSHGRPRQTDGRSSEQRSERAAHSKPTGDMAGVGFMAKRTGQSRPGDARNGGDRGLRRNRTSGTSQQGGKRW